MQRRLTRHNFFGFNENSSNVNTTLQNGPVTINQDIVLNNSASGTLTSNPSQIINQTYNEHSKKVLPKLSVPRSHKASISPNEKLVAYRQNLKR